MKDEDLEKGVHEKDSVGLDGSCVKEDWLWWSVKGVGIKDWLDHDQTLRQIFPQ